MLLAQIATNGEAVDNAGEQVDLVWLLGLDKDLFGCVALLGGEDLIGFGGGDGEGSSDGAEFILFNETVLD